MFGVPGGAVAGTSPIATGHPVALAMAYAADRSCWADLLRYDPDERYAALIGTDSDHEAWLLSWLPEQGVELHDHGDSSGAFTVVTGTLRETILRSRYTETPHPGAGRTSDVHAGISRVFGPGYAHQVRNPGPDPAISIHVYRLGSRTVRPL